MHRWFLALFVLSFTAHGQAADLTVGPGQSIKAALSQMHAGDTLTIEEGTYDEQELHPPSGVTVQGAEGHTVVIRPTGHPTTGFEFGGSQITISNLIIDGSDGGVSTGMFITGSDNIIENVTVVNPTFAGIALFCPGSDNHQDCGDGGNTLRNVHASGAGMGPTGCRGGGDGLCHGVYTYTNDNIIVGGEFEDNNGFGIQIYGFDNTIQKAFVHDNVTGGITLNGSATVENSIVTHNGANGQAAAVWVIGPGSTLRDLTITDNGTVGLALKADASGTTVDNVFSQGNHPNLLTDSDASISVNGSGATLDPGQTP